jgi:glycosyltransferase involved in cell wall biosynthesis
VPQHRDGRDPAAPLRIVCVARAVEKKGLRLLLEALSRLTPSFSFELDHYGGGELLPSLKVEASRLGFDGRVRWHGAVAHQQVIAALDGADLFVLPLSVATDGDRDGIPNAVLEAQARGVCVLTTVAGSIDEAIVDGETGRIVQGAEGLALAIEELGRAPADRERLASSALRARRDTFSAEAGYDAIAKLLRAQMDVT